MSLDAEVHVSTLKCGVTLLVEPMSDVQSAAYSILVPAGTVYEPNGANGAAAVLADIVTRGAGNYDSRELNDRFDRMGVQRSEVNGWHFLSFNGALLPGHLSASLELYADVLLRAHLPADELEAAVVGVEQSLRAMEDEPQRKVFVEVRRSTYDDPWGRPPEGTLSELPNITPEVIRGIYDSGFRPNGTIIGVAGRVDAERVRRQLDELLTDWQPQGEAILKPGPRQPSVRHISHDSAQTHVGLAWEAAPFGHPDYYAAWAAANILGGSSSSRLFTEVRERRGLCYSVATSLNSVLDQGRIFAYVGTTTERAQETLDVTISEIAKMNQGIERGELERCQANAKSALVMQQESTSARASSIARDWFYLGRVQTLAEVHEQVQSLTVDQVQDYLRRQQPGEMTLITVGSQPLRIG
ncbi:MAG: M16 family metallopeptidase [Planctomycetaceae bacterium]